MKKLINRSWAAVIVLSLMTLGLMLAGCGDDEHVRTPTAPAALAVTTASLSAATVGTPYSQPLAATGGTTPYTWSLSAGALPAGLSLNATTGLISGTPTTAGAATNFTVKVTDSASPAATATKALSITVAAPAALSITTASPLAPGTVGNVYGPVTLVASGGTTPYTWAGSPLPTGLLLSTAGVITGTPTTAGTVSANITVTDAAAGNVTKALSITVNAAGAPLSITTTSPLAAGTVGAAYGPVTLVATGGTTPYTWTIASGSALPAVLTLSAGGVISGTPTTAGTVSTNIKVTDAAAGTVTKALSITVNAAVTPPALNTLTPSCATACHGLPPTSLTNVAGSTSSMPHTTNTLCGICHVIGGWVPGTTTFNMSGVATHNNGTINILAGLPTASCSACHGLPPGSPHPSVSVKAYVANCGICHLVGPGNPITMGIGTHNNGVINFNP